MAELILVRATRMGYYNNRRYREGEKFQVPVKDFSDASKTRGLNKVPGWMEKVETKPAAKAPAPKAPAQKPAAPKETRKVEKPKK